MTALLVVAGLILLVAGGELLVRGAVRIAIALGTSPLIIGLTVVAFGTSSPELAVSVLAGLRGSADLAIGNVVGSNVFNVLFVLGISALVVPLGVSQQLVRLDVPIMIGVSVLLVLFALDGTVSVREAIVFVTALVAYLGMQILITRRSHAQESTEVVSYEGRWYLDAGLVLLGLSLLIIGSDWLVEGAIGLARMLGVTELAIGLTVVAAGTSMPEVATSVVASFRGQRDIAVGNVIGSNIFNILGVLGFTGVITGAIPVSAAAVGVDLPIMLAVAVLCLPIFLSGYTISRWEGLLFLGYYSLYMTYIILDAAQHDSIAGYRAFVLSIIVPLTVATVLIFTLRSWQRQKRA